MKRMIALSALLGAAFATASLSSAFAQNGTPSTPPPKPNKVVTTPPPPPGGPDKLTTNTGPKLPGAPRKPRQPGVVDDIAGDPGKGKPVAWEQTCRDSIHCEFLRSLCTAKGGGMSTNPDGSETCTVYEGPHVIGSYRGPVMPPKPPVPGINTLTGKPNVQKYVVKWTCSSEQSCKYLDYGCGAVGGGMSSNGDGTQTCTVE
jgi:hypothetical protein